ncbi:TlpA family protein disulfide reductase [Flavobacteriaceae bacterium]|jgi:thiol-disulfide isomerase/thioredoxin|nr:TlpA family protein disulfide reductase [Flavobacteriaceae bacterium]
MRIQKRINTSENLQKRKKIISLFLICFLTIITSTAFSQNNNTSSNSEQLNGLKKTLKKISISDLGSSILVSDSIKAYSFGGELINKEELQSAISYWLMDPESEIYVDNNNAISLIIIPKKEEEVVVNKIHAEGLKRISEEEFFNRRIRFEDENYTFYGANNEKLMSEDALKKVKSGMYKVDAYVDANDQFKLAYLLKMTQEQMNQGMEEVMKMQNDFEAKLKGKPFPDFTLTDLSGTTHTSESIKGKVVAINLWFTACAPCIHEMPELNKIVGEYKENEDVLFLAFALDPKGSRLDKFLKKHKFDYNIIPDSQKYITKKLNPPGYPTHIVLDKNSNVVFLFSGYTPQAGEAIKSYINSELKK